ncbi:glycosylphosphatidylinositol anchor biosynthesis, partial [Coemansia sp. RSA 1694]
VGPAVEGQRRHSHHHGDEHMPLLIDNDPYSLPAASRRQHRRRSSLVSDSGAALAPAGAGMSIEARRHQAGHSWAGNTAPAGSSFEEHYGSWCQRNVNMLASLFPCAAVALTLLAVAFGASSSEERASQFFDGSETHTNNWAVLVCTSRFWFNYRHMANTLSMYRTVKRMGIPDSHIILMLADDMACNPRNSYPAAVYDHPRKTTDLYGDNVEVDYRGYEVTVENFIRLLTGRVAPDTPRNKRLLTDDKSNVFIYMTGHGGEDFLKFQDSEEINSYDIADAFKQMWEKQRYREILFVIDTCQANTMYSKFDSPNILSIGSSKKGQNSLSHYHDSDLGVSVIDRFTYYNLEFFESVDLSSKKTLADLIAAYNTSLIRSDPGVRTDLFARDLKKTYLTDFFGAVQNVELTAEAFPIGGSKPKK